MANRKLTNEYLDDIIIDNRHFKDSRAKEKYKARQEVDAYLDRQTLKKLLMDYDDDFYWDDNYIH